MRPEAVIRMGYWPLPPQTTRILAGCLHPGANERAPIALLDPGAGEGVALAALAEGLREHEARTVRTYGAELSHVRAKAARNTLDEVVSGDWFGVHSSNDTFSLMLLNPPYDWEGGDHQGEDGEELKQERQEYTWLRHGLAKLRMAGILLYVVPRKILGIAKVARFLAAHLDEVQAFRLPDGEYEQFEQVVVAGRRRPIAADKTVAETLQMVGAKKEDEEGNTLDEWQMEMPVLSEFCMTLYVPAAAKAFDQITFYLPDVSHDDIIDLIAGYGVTQNPQWQQHHNPPALTEFAPAVPMRAGHLAMLLASGLLQTTVLEQGNMLVKGQVIKAEKQTTDEARLRVYKEEFRTRVFILHRNGHFRVIDDTESLDTFMHSYGPTMAEMIVESFRPLYLAPSEDEWRLLAHILPAKYLPGRKVSGLLETQKHLAIALARVLLEHGFANLIGEMGLGKTITAIAVVELLHLFGYDSFPALVLCPPHLAKKWKREIQAALPGTRVIIARHIGHIRRIVENYKSGRLFVIVKSTDASKGSGWVPAARTRVRHYRDRYDKQMKQMTVLECPRCAAQVVDRNGYPVEQLDTKKKVKCHTCGEPLYQYYNRFSAHLHRWPVAEYIYRQAPPKFFKTLITDEVHQYKGQDTDRGESYFDLVQSVDYALNLTGTWFGGYSKDIFYLLYRTSPRMKEDYSYRGVGQWARDYGRVMRIEKAYEERKRNARLTGKLRWNTDIREMPGISPRIVGRILDTTVFATIENLGYQLPPLVEEVVQIPMDPAQYGQYKTLERDLHSHLKQWGTGMHWLSVYIQHCLGRPNGGHREDEVWVKLEKGENGKRTLWRTLPPVFEEDELSPKEAWLVDYCHQEKWHGRKVLIYVRQTQKRDIRKRLERILKDAGIAARQLPDSLDTDKREEWIEKNAPKIDVLIVNPKKVETGLDLVQFATAIFLEIEHSLFVLWQAMKRIHRPGQTQPVKIVYAVYAEALEEEALALVGAKKKAAHMLYGDNAASAIEPDENESADGFMEELYSIIESGNRKGLTGFTGLVTEQSGVVSQWSREAGYQSTAGPVWEMPVYEEPVAEPRFSDPLPPAEKRKLAVQESVLPRHEQSTPDNEPADNHTPEPDKDASPESDPLLFLF